MERFHLMSAHNGDGFLGGSRSPTSVSSDHKPCRSPRGFEGVGLGILAALHNDTHSKTTLLSPKSSPVNKKRSQPISIGPTRPPMEYSESYTCITSHGPKPIIHHIFTDPVEVQKRNVKYRKPAVFEKADPSYCDADAPTFASADFLSVCYLCRRQLRHGKDIYMYRGDKAFCSVECRYEQIVSDDKERCSMKRVAVALGSSPQASSCFYPGTNIFSTGTIAAA